MRLHMRFCFGATNSLVNSWQGTKAKQEPFLSLFQTGKTSSCAWSVTGVKYVSHLIDLDREFYDKLRLVMDDAGGTLQLAGQTYRHFTGNIPAGEGPHTVTLPARVKSVKSIFGTFIDSTQVGNNSNYDTSVFQQAKLSKYRFEIGSVRYPQTDVNAASRENICCIQ